MSQRQRLFLVAAAVPVVGLLLSLAATEVSSRPHLPGVLDVLRTHPLQSLLILTLVAIVLAVLALIMDTTKLTIALSATADELAIAFRSQWVAEARWRHLYDPYAIPVRWTAADPDLVMDWEALRQLTTSPGWPVVHDATLSMPNSLSGTGNELVDVLARVPTRRLVVLGEPGAGKSILLVRLVLDLLERRAVGGAVPILLPLASWNPVEEDLNSWIEHWLITDKSVLSRHAPDSKNVSLARALIDKGLILPVLDGLDEIPEPVRGSAIGRINEAMVPGQQLVLASRTDAYHSVVRPLDGIGEQLVGAAGIVLCPLDADVVVEYLRVSARGRDSAARWKSVFTALTEVANSPVTQALTTPLMAAMARAIYNPGPSETLSEIPQPAELLESARFHNRRAIERHLLDRFIPASYRFDKSLPYRSDWTPRQAQRWLTFLANDLEHRQHTTDLAWWKLSGAAPRSLAGVVIGVLVGVAAAIGFSIPAGKGFDLQHGLGFVVTVSVGLMVRTWMRTRDRQRARVKREDLSRGLAGGIIGGLLGAVAAGGVFGFDYSGVFLAMALGYGIGAAPFSRVTTSLIAAFSGVFLGALSSYATALHEFGQYRGPITILTNGIGFGLAAGVAVGLVNRDNPARSMRWSPLGLLCGVVVGCVIGVVTWLQVGRPTAGLLIGVVGAITGGYAGAFMFEVAETDVATATTPRDVLVRDRSAFRAGGLGPGLAVGANTGLAFAFFPSATDGLPNGLELGLGVGTASVIGVGLACGFIRASWGSYETARIWLAITRRLPWRLVDFLDDAHQRGVLRQAGAVYQFRHTELQRHLARTETARISNRADARPNWIPRRQERPDSR
jgi:NACHT domain